MIFVIRPSKCFLFNFLERRLKGFENGIGLDAASASFKNRPMFKTNKYFGLDINEEAIKLGLQKHVSSNTFGLVADLGAGGLSRLPDNSVGLIVSTNTLYVLPFEKRIKAVEELCRLAAPEGCFFCDLVLDKEADEIEKIMEKNFVRIEKIYYKNPISRLYEAIFEKNGYLGSHPVAGTRPFLLLSWLLSRLEYLTCGFKFLNKGILIIGSIKRAPGIKQNFSLSDESLIADRFYKILKNDEPSL